jgi:hypothetical protein
MVSEIIDEAMCPAYETVKNKEEYYFSLITNPSPKITYKKLKHIPKRYSCSYVNITYKSRVQKVKHSFLVSKKEVHIFGIAVMENRQFRKDIYNSDSKDGIYKSIMHHMVFELSKLWVKYET